MGSLLYTISIAVHNRLDLTEKCIRSIREHSSDFEIFVFDNASSDGTREWLASQPDVETIRSEMNLGFGTPHNFILNRAHAPCFVVLNNDVEVCPGWLTTMKSAFDADPALALCGIKGTCSDLGSDGIGRPGALDYIEASCLMTRTELVRKHGLFSPEFRFAYSEDSDLSLRMQSLGHTIAVVDIPVRHLRGATAKILNSSVDLEGYRIRNRHILLSKWKNFFDKKRGAIRSKVLIKRTGARGDVLMLTPALAAFKAEHPGVHVAVATACPDVLAENPSVDSIQIEDPGRNQFSRIFDLDLAYEKRPLEHPVRVYADELELDLGAFVDLRPKIYPNTQAREDAGELLRKTAPRNPKYAVIHAGLIPGWVGRQWNGKWDELFLRLRGLGYRVVRIGTGKTPEFQADITALDQPFKKLAAIMERADLFVGLDSMPLHVAQAFSIPTVGIFGSIDPKLRLVPGDPRSVGVTAAGVGCLGCHNYLPSPRTVTNSCLRTHELCMERISIDDIVAGIREVTK
jgi:GT2 family glycosyltransferase/ADP-heptose:LPS heptosyltransferase